MKFLASLGIIGVIINLCIAVACFYCWFEGVVYGFHHSIILGLVSIIPPVGFVEGILHLLHVLV